MSGLSDLSDTCSILIVEDEIMLAKDLARSLSNLGYEVVGRVSSAEDAIRLVEDFQPDLILMDVKLDGDKDGIEAADIIRREFDIPVVYLTGFAEEDILERAKKTEPYGYLGKPVGLLELRNTLDTALYKHEADKKLRESEARFRQIFEQSPDANVIYDYDGYIDCNESCVRMLGLKSREDLLSGQPNNISPEFQPDGRSSLEKAQDMMEIAFSKGSHRFEWVCQKPDGAPVYLDIVANRIMLQGKAVIHAMGRDIGDRKKAEEALRESEQRYRNIVEIANEGIWMIDNKGKTTFANKQMAEMLGTTTAEMLGKSFLEYIDEDQIPLANLNFEKRSEGIAEHHDFKFRRLDGSEIWTNVSTVPTYDSQGKFSGALAMISDITPGKKAEEALRDSEERYRALYNKTPALLHSIDADGKIISVSDRWLEFLGYERDEVIGRASLDFLTEESRRIAEEVNLPKFFREGSANNVPYKFVTKTGATVDALMSAIAEYDSQGRFVRSLAVIEAINERKELQRTEEEKRKLLESIWRTSPVGIALARNRVFEWVNARWCEMFGFVESDVLGKCTSIGYASVSEFARVGKTLDESLESKLVSETQALFRRKDGTLFHGRIWTTYLDPKNHKKGVIAAIVDISDQLAAQEKIKASLAEKEVLLREIHHRVKNNLAIISSLLSLRAEYPSDKTAQELFDEVKTRIRSMAIAHEILYQSENLAYISIQDYLGNLLNHILYSHGSIGTSVSLETEIEEVSFGLNTAIPLGFLLTEVISNCLKHAFPYGRQGKIRVSLRSVNDREFELIIADNGVGIPESVDFRNPKSMGMDLIDTFVDQLQGSVEISGNQGAEVRILFKDIGSKAQR